ncbi:unnamed protein product [Adineta steineri]|uniref:G-protein coupled receptors family 1 profile domain-containing protein n=1 Tax=Adineta steineri TaxID=433720 RepID=A0A814Q3P7_9BILA|nr:unnamed protein product [Adineta steineri]CAF1296208.1 unnamed protein product [Adineta steineri]
MATTTNISTVITLTSSVQNLPHYYRFQKIHSILTQISYPYIFIIALIGLVTNTSTVILLSKNNITKNLKNKWTLIALALSDLLFNTALLIRVIHDMTKQKVDRLCIIISFLSHLAELLSALYTVSFTIQRYCAVRYPFKAASQRRSSPIISLLLILLLSTLFCGFMSRNTLYIECHEELHLNWFIADALLSFIIPFFLILIFNILIMNYIRKHSRSPISIQSILIRKRKLSKNSYKAYNPEDTLELDYNPATNITAAYSHFDGNDNIEIKYPRKKQSLAELENRIYRPSISSLLERANSETSSNFYRSPSRTRSKMLFKKRHSHPRKKSSNGSFTTRATKKFSYPSNDNELTSKVSTRASQSIRVTRMLVLVSTCFLILNAPAHLFAIATKIYTVIIERILTEQLNQNKDLKTELSIHSNATNTSSLLQYGTTHEDKLAIHILYMGVTLTHFVSYASYSINFFLYSFSGIAFRTSLGQLINKLRRF